jgi:hypothetical protein
MGSRTFDTILDCGCMLSSDGGGGLIPCCYGYGCGKKECGEGDKQCKKCLKHERFCKETWNKFYKSKKYKEHLKLCKEKNE